MKKTILFITALAVLILFGCNQTSQDTHEQEGEATEHTHEVEATEHSHEGEDATHTHEGEEAIQTPQQEDEGTTHTHEGDTTTHTHAGVSASDIEAEVRISVIKKQEFQDIIKTSGVILPSREDVRVYYAPVNGFIHFTNKRIVPGSVIQNRQELFDIRGGVLSDENSDLKYQEITRDFEKQKQNFERAGKLINDKIISEEEYLEVKNSFENARSRYELYRGNREQGRHKIISNVNGFVKDIFMAEGEYVEAGDKVATIISQNKLILQADVPQNHFNKLGTFTGATFTTPYSYRVYRSEALNGKLLAFGKSTDETSFFMPVTFEIDHHPDLIPGSFVEINLKGKTIEEAIVIPRSALMEEQGMLYVFVQHVDGDFEKQYVELGADDGEFVQVLSGLSENQKVVIEGAYFVKLASLSTELPDTHSH